MMSIKFAVNHLKLNTTKPKDKSHKIYSVAMRCDAMRWDEMKGNSVCSAIMLLSDSSEKW